MLGCRMSRLLETWCLMEYAEKGSLADALRTGRLKRPGGFPELGIIIACLQDIASGEGLVIPGSMAPHCCTSLLLRREQYLQGVLQCGALRLVQHPAGHSACLLATMEDICRSQQCSTAGSVLSSLLLYFDEELRLL